tara:strand:+ start:45 stop:599 length:555 start_codon:yes stop_codon:yes gene_type:complete
MDLIDEEERTSKKGKKGKTPWHKRRDKTRKGDGQEGSPAQHASAPSPQLSFGEARSQMGSSGSLLPVSEHGATLGFYVPFLVLDEGISTVSGDHYLEFTDEQKITFRILRRYRHIHELHQTLTLAEVAGGMNILTPPDPPPPATESSCILHIEYCRKVEDYLNAIFTMEGVQSSTIFEEFIISK